MGVLDWLFKRNSTEAAAPGLSLPARKATPAWRPAGLLPEQLEAFLKEHEPRALPPELSGGAPRREVWGANALKDATLHRALTHGHASPCLVTTASIGGQGICIYRGSEGQPRSFTVEVPSQVRSFPLRLNALEHEGKRGGMNGSSGFHQRLTFLPLSQPWTSFSGWRRAAPFTSSMSVAKESSDECPSPG